MLMYVEAGHASVHTFGMELKGGWVYGRTSPEGVPSACKADGRLFCVGQACVQVQV